MRLIFIAAIGAAAISFVGLLAMAGTLRALVSPGLTAEVQLSEFPLPKDFGLEPQIVADFLVEELTRRGTEDIALRFALGESGQEKLAEIVIPRLVSPALVRAMIARIEPLANALSVGSFRLTARVAVRNSGPARSDVALTVPGAALVEDETGRTEIVQTESGLTALALGEMASGEERSLRVWLDEAALAAGADLGRQVRLGDGSGARGRVWMSGHGTRWQGEDLQAIAAARWLVSGVLALVFIGSVLAVVILLLARLRGRRAISPA